MLGVKNISTKKTLLVIISLLALSGCNTQSYNEPQFYSPELIKLAVADFRAQQQAAQDSTWNPLLDRGTLPENLRDKYVPDRNDHEIIRNIVRRIGASVSDVPTRTEINGTMRSNYISCNRSLNIYPNLMVCEVDAKAGQVFPQGTSNQQQRRIVSATNSHVVFYWLFDGANDGSRLLKFTISLTGGSVFSGLPEDVMCTVPALQFDNATLEVNK